MLRKDEVLDIVKEQVFRWFEHELLQIEFLQLSVEITPNRFLGQSARNESECHIMLGQYGFLFRIYFEKPYTKMIGLPLYDAKIYHHRRKIRQIYSDECLEDRGADKRTCDNIYRLINSNLGKELRALVGRYQADFTKALKQPAKNASNKKDKK